MKEKDQIRHLNNELEKLLDRFAKEYDMSYASVVGVLMIKASALAREVQEIDSE
jgi:hypothetical protein